MNTFHARLLAIFSFTARASRWVPFQLRSVEHLCEGVPLVFHISIAPQCQSLFECTGVKQRIKLISDDITLRKTHSFIDLYHVFKSASKFACLRAFICCTDALRHNYAQSLCQESTCRPIHCKPLRLSRCFCYARQGRADLQDCRSRQVPCEGHRPRQNTCTSSSVLIAWKVDAWACYPSQQAFLSSLAFIPSQEVS